MIRENTVKLSRKEYMGIYKEDIYVCTKLVAYICNSYSLPCIHI